jgi:hypothetical protein
MASVASMAAYGGRNTANTTIGMALAQALLPWRGALPRDRLFDGDLEVVAT